MVHLEKRKKEKVEEKNIVETSTHIQPRKKKKKKANEEFEKLF